MFQIPRRMRFKIKLFHKNTTLLFILHEPRFVSQTSEMHFEEMFDFGSTIGPGLWLALHKCGEFVKNKDELFENMFNSLFLDCSECNNHLVRHKTEHPIDVPYNKYFFDFHNEVNRKLKKKTIEVFPTSINIEDGEDTAIHFGPGFNYFVKHVFNWADGSPSKRFWMMDNMKLLCIEIYPYKTFEIEFFTNFHGSSHLLPLSEVRDMHSFQMFQTLKKNVKPRNEPKYRFMLDVLENSFPEDIAKYEFDVPEHKRFWFFLWRLIL